MFQEAPTGKAKMGQDEIFGNDSIPGTDYAYKKGGIRNILSFSTIIFKFFNDNADRQKRGVDYENITHRFRN